VGYLGLNPNKCEKPSVFIIADTIEMYPRETYEKGMAVITASVIRNHPNALSPRIKSLNYLNNILAKIEAVDAGVPRRSCSITSARRRVHGRQHLHRQGGELLTPTMYDGILEGVTRDTILMLARKHEIPRARRRCSGTICTSRMSASSPARARRSSP
jgi:branched-chain amino acid aminotransferase